MKNRTACFSGHRQIPNDQYPVIWKTYWQCLQTLYRRDTVTLEAGVQSVLILWLHKQSSR